MNRAHDLATLSLRPLPDPADAAALWAELQRTRAELTLAREERNRFFLAWQQATPPLRRPR